MLSHIISLRDFMRLPPEEEHLHDKGPALALYRRYPPFQLFLANSVELVCYGLRAL